MWMKDEPNCRQQITQKGFINDKNRKQTKKKIQTDLHIVK